MLSVIEVTKSFAGVRVLDRLSLDVADGEMTAVLGPSGCGKTTLLRCVAGFESIDDGSIVVAGRPVASGRRHVPPHRRQVAVVPQEGALFPHLSVANNVGYGLRRAPGRRERIIEVLALVGLAELGDRMPHELSGGQRQRVAVARALAPRPRLVLLDEPFSALDAGLRGDLRQDIKEALKADGATAVLVTHDQNEALSMADRVAILHDGRIVQHGTPHTIYRAPVNAWVASFVGEAIKIPGTVVDGVIETSLGRLPTATPHAAGPALALLRPEQLELGGGSVHATVGRLEYYGHDALVTLSLADGSVLTARVDDRVGDLRAGDQVTVSVRGSARLLT